MRPYRFKMRLSSRRLNVTRFSKAPAAALRATARASLGSTSSDIELMAHLLSSQAWSCSENRIHFSGSCRQGHDCADWPPPQEGPGGNTGFAAPASPLIPMRIEHLSRHRIVSGIIMPPHFRPPTALLNCDKNTCVGPVLSTPDSSAPSPPGSSGSGLSQNRLSPYWANASWSFFFWATGRLPSLRFPDGRIVAASLLRLRPISPSSVRSHPDVAASFEIGPTRGELRADWRS